MNAENWRVTSSLQSNGEAGKHVWMEELSSVDEARNS